MNTKYKGIWFYGTAGTGKTLASKFLKKKIKNSILLDGDQVRKYVSFDLGYSIKDREVQIKRVFGISKLIIQSEKIPIISTVYMNTNIKKKLKNENIFLVKIVRNFEKIKNRKHIYNKKMKNVIGVDISYPRIRNSFQIINDNSINEFYKKLSKIFI